MKDLDYCTARRDILLRQRRQLEGDLARQQQALQRQQNRVMATQQALTANLNELQFLQASIEIQEMEGAA